MLHKLCTPQHAKGNLILAVSQERTTVLLRWTRGYEYFSGNILPFVKGRKHTGVMVKSEFPHDNNLAT